MAGNTNPNFVEGEPLQWSSRLQRDGELTIRPVAFVGWKNNLAVVSFGIKAGGEPNLYSVPREELIRPQPPQAQTPLPTPAPAPIIPLEERRRDLAQAFAEYREAQDAVAGAQTLVDRALVRVENAKAELRNYADMEAHAVDAIVHELRHMNGHSIADDDEQWQQRDRAQRECRTSEQAYDVLARELSDAKSVASEREQALHKASSFVLAAIIERESDKLSALECQSAELRVKLQAAQLLWYAGEAIPLGPAAAKVLNEPPPEIREGVSERMANTEARQLPFSALFARLVAGDIEADL